MDVDEKPVRAARGVRVEARGLRQVVRGGQETLRDISLTVLPGELVAIIGASGAGKTTLLETLAGVRPSRAGGTVRYDDAADLRGGTGFLPSAIGYVPQDDIIRKELPLARTLRYAARLRLPAGTSEAEVTQRVGEVLRSLGLVERADVPVGLLSGGERKRASIAVELLTRPRVLFFDEPTSGLDPATAVDTMAVLRALADGGATVILTTHNVADVESCDRVAVLARGGRLAFDGTPAGAPEHFGVRALADIYVRLDRDSETRPGTTPQPTPQPTPSPTARSTPQSTPRPSVGPEGGPTTPPESASREARRLSRLRQWFVLSVRNVDILRRNRLTLAILLGSPLMVLAMFLMLFRPAAFDPANPSPSATVMILFWIAFGGFFFGLTYGLLQICTELPVLRRERLAGVRIGPYVLSKFAVLLPILAVVDLALLSVLRLLDRLPALGAGPFGELFTTLLLSSGCALALGLLCSAAVSDVAQAALMLPMLCFPQVLFVGAILPVPVMASVGQWVSYAMSNRWTFEALGHSVGLPALWRDGGSPLGPPLLATYEDSFDRAVGQNWLILAGFTVLFLVATWAALVRKGRRGTA